MALCVLVSILSCREKEESAPKEQVPDRTAQSAIVAFGDSLTAGYGMGLDEAYPARLQEILDRENYAYEVVNAGVSGDTTASGVRRLDWVLEGREVAVLILALGANDGLRGLPPTEMKKNLASIIEAAKSRGVQVLLAGFTAPPDQKDRYLREFVSVYPELAQEHGVALMPFLLQDVAGRSALNQADGRHPNDEGARIIAENVFQHLRPLLPPPSSAAAATP
jgi:acyl-CoA thioesterase-1